ncbi:HAD-IA family hydrolase [Butyrivibrio fibrisolvens]|uniref:HAD-IA family hydrolase n=1 Tax=Butyrivibrio fibrisolvens TaxID=831 RepID=UPI0003B509FC|nr:HAD-IA family hydrolase [Butyrivibrio fibrisolvens]
MAINQMLANKINEAEIVSFDIFDTLIVRLYRTPTDLFRHLESAKGVNGFTDARIAGEREARKKASEQGKEEVTLSQIYDEMHVSYRAIKDQEVSLEMAMCKNNPEMHEIYDECLKLGKRVVIISDMYLTIDTVKAILGNAGYDRYERLFLSSEAGVQKATGNLYKHAIEELKDDSSKILHIGDHIYTDVEMAEQQGIKAFHYLPLRFSCGDMNNGAFFATLNRYSNGSVVPSILQGLISLHNAQNQGERYWINFGYKYMGILAVSYVRWLHDEFEKAGIKKAYFMLRDGYIFKKVFDYLYPDFETHEIYGSRSMFMLASMEKYEDLKKYVPKGNWQGVTYRRYYDWINVKNHELEQKYVKRFSNLDAVIDNNSFDEIDDFFKENETILFSEGDKERDTIMSYFKSIGLLDGKAAIVDLGWKASMLKGVEKVIKNSDFSCELYGYYLATHPFEPMGIRTEAFGMTQGKPDKESPYKYLIDPYVVKILELAFSAPHPSVLKIRKEGEKFEPVYQHLVGGEKVRTEICKQMIEGILSFTKDFSEINNACTIHTDVRSAICSLEYFATSISKYDERQLSAIEYYPGVGEDATGFPILKNGVFTFGIIDTWPGDESAELEVIWRIKKAAEECDLRCIPIDGSGHVLTGEKLGDIGGTIENVDSVFSLHFDSPKTLDAFYYHTLWNPPEIPLGRGDYCTNVSANYLMYDDFLVYGKGGMKNHLLSILTNKPRNIEGASQLMASFPESVMMKSDLSNPKIFYCGMNWDVLEGGKGRNESVMKLLDEAEVLRIYGPDAVKAWGGVRPWAGYKCYQRPLPFDGFSLISELNKCGICLVLSSDSHRRAGAVTNRAFEACAAGAVMISDDNPLMKELFPDAALFVRYNKNNPQDTFKQIKEKYDWILSHKEDAATLVERAQKIFREKLSLNVYLRDIVSNHSNRQRAIAQDLFAKDESKKVLVLYVCYTLDINVAKERIDKVISNIKNQDYRSIIPVVVVDTRIKSEVDAYLENTYTGICLVSKSIFDFCGAPQMTQGQVLMDIRKQYAFDYFMLTKSEEIWFYDHVTTLVRTVEDEKCMAAHSGEIFRDLNNNRHNYLFRNIKVSDTENACDVEEPYKTILPFPGAFLFEQSVQDLIPDYVAEFLDGHEYIAFIRMLLLKKEEKIAFSKRVSFMFDDTYKDSTNLVLKRKEEKNFIWDLTRYEAELRRGNENAVAANAGLAQLNIDEHRRQSLETLAHFNPKTFIKVRYYGHLLSKKNLPDGKRRKIQDKFNEQMRVFYQKMGL